MSFSENSAALILIVDDEVSNLDMLSRRLLKKGYEVVTAGGVSEARVAVEAQLPDIILLDIMMPGISGLDYLQELRASTRTANTPVIMVSALDQSEDVVRGLSLGANDYVSKPVNFPILTARLATHLSVGRLLRTLERQNLLLSELAALDSLTGVYNRRMGIELFRKLIAGGVRESVPITVAMMDIDHFKRINDTHGHPAGDAVLCEFAKRIGEGLRAADVLFRYGGEEFAVVLPETREDRAMAVANRLREVVEIQPFHYGELSIPVTVSVGICTRVAAAGLDPISWIELADHALYQAKIGGRNRVCVDNGSAIGPSTDTKE